MPPSTVRSFAAGPDSWPGPACRNHTREPAECASGCQTGRYEALARKPLFRRSYKSSVTRRSAAISKSGTLWSGLPSVRRFSLEERVLPWSYIWEATAMPILLREVQPKPWSESESAPRVNFAPSATSCLRQCPSTPEPPQIGQVSPPMASPGSSELTSNFIYLPQR